MYEVPETKFEGLAMRFMVRNRLPWGFYSLGSEGI